MTTQAERTREKINWSCADEPFKTARSLAPALPFLEWLNTVLVSAPPPTGGAPHLSVPIALIRSSVRGDCSFGRVSKETFIAFGVACQQTGETYLLAYRFLRGFLPQPLAAVLGEGGALYLGLAALCFDVADTGKVSAGQGASIARRMRSILRHADAPELQFAAGIVVQVLEALPPDLEADMYLAGEAARMRAEDTGRAILEADSATARADVKAAAKRKARAAISSIRSEASTASRPSTPSSGGALLGVAALGAAAFAASRFS